MVIISIFVNQSMGLGQTCQFCLYETLQGSGGQGDGMVGGRLGACCCEVTESNVLEPVRYPRDQLLYLPQKLE